MPSPFVPETARNIWNCVYFCWKNHESTYISPSVLVISIKCGSLLVVLKMSVGLQWDMGCSLYACSKLLYSSFDLRSGSLALPLSTPTNNIVSLDGTLAGGLNCDQSGSVHGALGMLFSVLAALSAGFTLWQLSSMCGFISSHARTGTTKPLEILQTSSDCAPVLPVLAVLASRSVALTVSLGMADIGQRELRDLCSSSAGLFLPIAVEWQWESISTNRTRELKIIGVSAGHASCVDSTSKQKKKKKGVKKRYRRAMCGFKTPPKKERMEPPTPMICVKIFQGWPPRDAPAKLVQLWYKTWPADNYGWLEMKMCQRRWAHRCSSPIIDLVTVYFINPRVNLDYN